MIDALAANQFLQLVFGVDGDALRISASTQRGWIPPAGDARDLGGREGDDLVAGVLTEVGIEGVEVPSGCPLMSTRSTVMLRSPFTAVTLGQMLQEQCQLLIPLVFRVRACISSDACACFAEMRRSYGNESQK